ncbi:AAA family ATPase [Bacillus mycoides]|uniref:AAA family ATPase n=1 Tax=Bacillus mycoides TaxID=1405 RepID=UPI0038148B87
MEILYLWINQKNRLENLSLNFGGEFLYNITDNKLTIEENNFYIKNFFYTTDFLNKSPNISTVTGIVGENGTGKSTILNSLMEIIENNRNVNFDYLIFYKVKEDYYYDYVLKKDIHYGIKCINNQINIIYDKATFYYKPLNQNLFSTVFFSNIFDIRALGKDLPIKNNIIDLSTNNLYNHKSYLSDQIHNQIIFTKKYEHNFKIKERINIPTEIEIEYNNSFEKEMKITSVPYYEALIDYYNKLIHPEISNNTWKENQFAYDFRYNTYLSFYIEIFNEIRDGFDLNEKDITALLFNFKRSTGLVGHSNQFSDYYQKLMHDLQDFLRTLTENRIESQNLSEAKIIKKTKRIFKDIDKRFSQTEKLLNLLTKLHIKDVKNRFLIPSSDPILLEFINTYNEYEHPSIFIKMYWSELSSGEYAFLSLFSRFNSIIDKINENLIILIDEGDIYFHPQWQKDWLYTFLDIISYMYKKSNIQIVLTTHSPFILSDLPSKNVIFLKKNQNNTTYTVKNLEGNQLTFAANIHELLTNSFFMHDGLVGKFAQNKINNLIDKILDSTSEDIKKDASLFKQQIDMVGEPIVKRKLIEIFEDKIKLDVLSVNEKIERLQQQIDELKAIKHDKN